MWGGVISEDRLSIARDSVRSHNLTRGRGLAQSNPTSFANAHETGTKNSLVKKHTLLSF